MADYRIVDKDYFKLVGKPVADVIYQFLTFISYDDHYSVEVET